jgi:hypothetical protein
LRTSKSANEFVSHKNVRLEEDVKEYSRQIQILRDEKYSKHGDDNMAIREKMKSKNKLIEELEDENTV